MHGPTCIFWANLTPFSLKIARHLADYVLVWAGGGGDDMAKSPHMARIGNSVYHDICPGALISSLGPQLGGSLLPAYPAAHTTATRFS